MVPVETAQLGLAGLLHQDESVLGKPLDHLVGAVG